MFFRPIFSNAEKEYTGPKIWVRRKVLEDIINDAKAHPPTETGLALFGIRLPQTIFILGTIPAITNVIRQAGFFQQGGQDQVEIFRWYQKHWDGLRESARDNVITDWSETTPIPKGTLPKDFLDLPLLHVGDWHKHPGQLKVLSSVDTGTIEDMFRDPAARMTEFVAPLLTVSYGSGGELLKFSYQGNELQGTYSYELVVQTNWYYLHKDDPIIWSVPPVIVEDSCSPWIPPLPWYLTDLERMQWELDELRRCGYEVRWTVRQMDKDAEMEIIFAVDKPEWTSRALLITDWNYPDSRPVLKIYPKNGRLKETERTEKKTLVVESFRQRFQDWIHWIVWGEGYDDIYSIGPDNLYNRPWKQESCLVDLVMEAEQKGVFNGPAG